MIEFLITHAIGITMAVLIAVIFGMTVFGGERWYK